jgi:hypothetical protein
MKRETRAISVEVVDDHIVISDNYGDGDEQRVGISADQVELLVKHLTEARDELSQKSNSHKKGLPPGDGGAEDLGGYSPGVK